MANQKRISELPIINALSGSATSVIPVVVGGTTNQIPAERFSEFVNAYNATTSSNNFIGNQTITGDLDISGNTIIGGDVEIAGMITAQQYNVTYVSSSIQYQSGSTEFGDTADDTHIFTGTIVLNGNAIGLGELNAQTSSQDSLNTSLGLITSSIYDEITSIDNVLSGVSSVTGAYAVELGSIDSHILGVSTQTGSQDLVNLGISSVTGSLIGITNGLMAFTASLDTGYATDEQLYQLYQATRSLEIQTGSQNSINSGISAVTGAFATELGDIQDNITSFNNVFGGVSAVTGAFSTELGQLQTQNTSQGGVNNGISAVTGAFATELGSIDSHILKQANQTGSQDLVNLGISSVTGSLIGITNGLMAFTAALDSTYATDVEVADAVSALNTQTGSQNSINSGISAVTGAFATELSGIQNNITSFDNVFGGVSAVTGAFATELGGIQTTLGGHRNELDGLESYTASLKAVNLVSGSSQIPQIAELFTQNTSQLGVNLGISTFTGSLRDEVNGIEAYTASLKGAIEVSGQDVNVLGMLTAQQFNVTYVSSSTMYQSGSTKFGDSSDDKHEFTGSVSISGSGDFYVGGPLVQSTDKATITLKQTGIDSNSGIYLENGSSRTGYYMFMNATDLVFQKNDDGSRDDVFSLSKDGDATLYSPGNFSTNVGNITAGGDLISNNSIIGGDLDIAGSSEFGGTSTHTHNFTGSLNVTGSINIISHGATGVVLNQDPSNAGVSSRLIFMNSLPSGMAIMNESGRMSFRSGSIPNGGSGTEVMSIQHNNLNLSSGNLVVASGQGIDFSATSNGSGTTSSELLDDYEEGTWTATLKGSVSDPTSPVTTTGYYTKVGNKVTIWVEFASVDTTGASGEVFVQGLPFTSSTNCKSPGGVVTFNLNFNSAEYLTAFMTANVTSFELLGARSSNTWTVATHTASANVYLIATITYFV
jgi:archaellum component FlaC